MRRLTGQEQEFVRSLDLMLEANPLNLSTLTITKSALENYLLVPPAHRGIQIARFRQPTSREQKVRALLGKIASRQYFLINETAAALNILPAALKFQWVPISRDDLFSEIKKSALIYLVTDTLLTWQRLTPMDAIREISGLNDSQIECLEELYIDGLRGQHLRSLLPNRFDAEALTKLIREQNVSPQQVIEQINALPEAEVQNYFESLRTQRPEPNR